MQRNEEHLPITTQPRSLLYITCNTRHKHPISQVLTYHKDWIYQKHFDRDCLQIRAIQKSIVPLELVGRNSSFIHSPVQQKEMVHPSAGWNRPFTAYFMNKCPGNSHVPEATFFYKGITQEEYHLLTAFLFLHYLLKSSLGYILDEGGSKEPYQYPLPPYDSFPYDN